MIIHQIKRLQGIKRMNHFSQNNTALNSSMRPHICLTKRETKIILLLIAGNTFTEIALQLSLSVQSIEFFIKNMKLKLTG